MIVAEDRAKGAAVAAPTSDDSSRRGPWAATPVLRDGSATVNGRDVSAMPNGDPPSLTLWGMDDDR